MKTKTLCWILAFILLNGCSGHRATVQYETMDVVFTNEPLYQTFRTGAQLDSLVTEEFGLGWDAFEEVYCKYGDPNGSVSFSETARKVALVINIADSLNLHYLPFSSKVDEIRILSGAKNIYHSQHYQGKISIPLGIFFYYPEEFSQSSVYHEFGHAFYWVLPLGKIKQFWLLYKRAMAIPGFLSLFKDSNYRGNRVHDGHPEEGPGELYASAFSITNLNGDKFRERIQHVSIEEQKLALEIEKIVLNTSTRRRERLTEQIIETLEK